MATLSPPVKERPAFPGPTMDEGHEAVGSVELKPAHRRPLPDLVEMSFMVELEVPRPACDGHR